MPQPVRGSRGRAEESPADHAGCLRGGDDVHDEGGVAKRPNEGRAAEAASADLSLDDGERHAPEGRVALRYPHDFLPELTLDPGTFGVKWSVRHVHLTDGVEFNQIFHDEFVI